MPELRPEFQPSIAVCTPMRFLRREDGSEYLEPITMPWHRGMKMLLGPMGYNVGEIRIDGYEVGEARNLAAKEAIQRGLKYLCFIDADTILPQNGLQLLTYQLDNRPDYDIAAGIYTQKSTPTVPLIWSAWGEGVYWDWTLGDVLTEGIVGCGTGCMLIRTSLFERLSHDEAKPWFCTAQGSVREDSQSCFNWAMSDDLWFCKRATEEVGAKIVIDTRVYCQHIDWKTGRIYQLGDDALPVRRLAEKLGEFSKGWMDSDEVGEGTKVLHRLAEEVVSREPDRPKLIIEVGSFAGHSGRIFAQHLQGHGTLYCVDTWKGTPHDLSGQLTEFIGGGKALYQQFLKNMDGYLGSTVIPLPGRSVDVAGRLQRTGQQADLIFIDADHHRVAEDLRAWLPLVRPDGILCGHDYQPDLFPPVVRDVHAVLGADGIEVEAAVWIKRFGQRIAEAAA